MKSYETNTRIPLLAPDKIKLNVPWLVRWYGSVDYEFINSCNLMLQLMASFSWEQVLQFHYEALKEVVNRFTDFDLT